MVNTVQRVFKLGIKVSIQGTWSQDTWNQDTWNQGVAWSLESRDHYINT